MIRPSIRAVLLGLCCSYLTPSFAIQPIANTFYAGLILGPTVTQSINFSGNPSQIPASTIDSFKTSMEQLFNISLDTVNLLLPNSTVNGSLNYDVLGGIAMEVGYRLCTQYRAEFELLYNDNPYASLKIGNYTIDAATSGSELHIDGDTSTIAGLVNFLYDFPITSKNNDGYSKIMPYIGGGLGYAYIGNSMTFYYGADNSDPENPTTLYETKVNRSRNSFAYQGIVGLSLFLDDFTWFSLDARYFGTTQANILEPKTNVTFESKTQLFSVMLGFHGAIGHG